MFREITKWPPSFPLSIKLDETVQFLRKVSILEGKRPSIYNELLLIY